MGDQERGRGGWTISPGRGGSSWRDLLDESRLVPNPSANPSHPISNRTAESEPGETRKDRSEPIEQYGPQREGPVCVSPPWVE